MESMGLRCGDGVSPSPFQKGLGSEFFGLIFLFKHLGNEKLSPKVRSLIKKMGSKEREGEWI